MTRYFILVIAFFLINIVNAQYIYEEADNVEVIKNGETLEAPFTSGYNTVQFSEFDLNQDGIMDLLVYDRSQGQVRPYVNLGIQDSVAYEYKAEYASKFPKLRSWLLTADYNEDGKMDLFDGESGMQLWENKSTIADGLKFELIGDLKSLYNSTDNQTIKIASNSTSLPGLYDIDKDGDIDIFTINSSNGVTVEYHRNLAVERGNSSYLDFERRNNCWGDFYDNNGTFVLDDCDGVPPGGEIIDPNTQNENELKLDKAPTKPKEPKSKHGISSMITPIDIDGNGSTDLIISDIDNYKTALLLNEDSIAPYVDSRIFKAIDSFPNYDISIDLLYPAVFFMDLNNDGKKDMVASPNTVETFAGFNLAVDDIYYYKNISTDQSIRLELQQKKFLIGQTLDFGLSAYPVFFDYNKDGLMDLVVGNDGYILIEESSNKIVGRLELFKNIGTATTPKFELVDSNYLDIPSKALNLIPNGPPTRNIIPTFGDIDGDGDKDLLLGDIHDNIFFFEDTSSMGNEAAFKLHPTPYSGLNIDGLGQTNAPRLFDINGDEILDLLVSDRSPVVNYYLNFGTKTNPIFNIKLDSIIFQANSVFRYYFEDQPNLDLFKVGDSVSVNNGNDPNNNTFVMLIITSINKQENYIECRNTIGSPPAVDSKYNETNTDAYLTFFDRSWGNLSESLTFLSTPMPYPYRENGKIELLLGSSTGQVHFYNNIENSTNPKDTFELYDENYLPNYGWYSYIDGADITNDGMIDLVIGSFSGGIKLLIAQRGVGIDEINSSSSSSNESFFTLFPNPATSYINVVVKSEQQNLNRFYLRDMSGKLIKKATFNTKTTKVDLEGLPQGIYVITIQNENFSETQKVSITTGF